MCAPWLSPSKPLWPINISIAPGILGTGQTPLPEADPYITIICIKHLRERVGCGDLLYLKENFHSDYSYRLR